MNDPRASPSLSVAIIVMKRTYFTILCSRPLSKSNPVHCGFIVFSTVNGRVRGEGATLGLRRRGHLSAVTNEWCDPGSSKPSSGRPFSALIK